MKVTKEGIYRDSKGNEIPVYDVGIGWSNFRAYWRGGYYDVNKCFHNAPGDVWEMVEFVRDFKVDKNGYKN